MRLREQKSIRSGFGASVIIHFAVGTLAWAQMTPNVDPLSSAAVDSGAPLTPAVNWSVARPDWSNSFVTQFNSLVVYKIPTDRPAGIRLQSGVSEENHSVALAFVGVLTLSAGAIYVYGQCDTCNAGRIMLISAGSGFVVGWLLGKLWKTEAGRNAEEIYGDGG